MGIFWTEHGTDGEDDIMGAWHCPVGDSKQLNLVKGGIEFTNSKTGEKEFIDLTPNYKLDSFGAYAEFSKSIEKYAPGYTLTTTTLIEDYIIGDVRRFEERLDIMGFSHFDGVSALREEAKKRYEPYFAEKLCKVKYTFGLKNYMEEFHPDTNVHEIEPHKTWVLINENPTIEEAVEFANKNSINLPKGKLMQSDKMGIYATSPMVINGKVITVKLERFLSSSFISDCGLKNYRFHGVCEKTCDLTYYPFHKHGKLFRLDHYYDLYKSIMEKLTGRNSIHLTDNDLLKGMQDFNWQHEPDLQYIKNTDTQKIIDTFKGIDELCEKWKIDRIPVIPLVKSIKRKIAEGKIRV